MKHTIFATAKNLTLTLFILLSVPFYLKAQIWRSGGVNINPNMKFNFNLKGGDKKNGATEGKPKDSERYKLGYLTDEQALKVDSTNLYSIADNLAIDIGSDRRAYPRGYGPKWNMVGSWGSITFEKTNFLQNRIKGQFQASLQIAGFNKKAYVYISNFLNCSCAAPLMHDNENAVITSQPTVFYADDFRKITSDGRVTNEPCKAMTGSFYDEGGWQLKLTLSVDNDKALHVAAIVESLTNRSNLISNNGTDVTSRWRNDDIVFSNQMTPQTAYADIAQKKQAVVDELARQKKEAADEKKRAYLDEQYAKMLHKIKLNPAANPKTSTTYKGYVLKAAIFGVDDLIGSRACKLKDLKTQSDQHFEKAHEKEFDVDIALDYAYNAGFLFYDNERVEPHEKDERFAVVYLGTKIWNDLMIQIAARYMVCDDEMVSELQKKTKDISILIDRKELDKITAYLKSKP